jgi:DNA-binding XRE family transcriptional regulator
LADSHLVYSLELRLIDLEKRMSTLEGTLAGVIASGVTSQQNGSADLPGPVIKRIEDGENTIRVIRQHRLLTQRELGDRCGIRPNHISAIERGMPYGLKTARRLADALAVPVDLLI